MDISQLTNNTVEDTDRLLPQAPPSAALSELTEDEDTAINSQADEPEEANETITVGVHNETDGTVSEAEDSDISEDEAVHTIPCKWAECSSVLPSPAQMTSHIVADHLTEKEKPGQPHLLYHCLWDGCTVTAPQRYKLICHVRKHTNDTPFHCFQTDCFEAFTDTAELSLHLSSTHNETRIDSFEWLAHLDQIRLDNLEPAPKKDIRSMRMVSRLNEREVVRSLNANKLDFLKVQNVTFDDIVTEPLKKKGRTANAEINAELREGYRKSNTIFKDRILQAAKQSFDISSKVETMPSFSDIDSLTEVELQDLHSKLERKLLWALEVNELLRKDVLRYKAEEEILWKKKELILDTTISHDLEEGADIYIPK